MSAPVLTKEARERLVALHNVYANRDGSGPARTADDIWTSLAYIDALEAERDTAIRINAELRRDLASARDNNSNMAVEVGAVRAERDALIAKLEFVIAPIEDGGGYAALMRAERDAALAEVARLKALVIDCIPFIGYQASVEDLKARAYEAVDYDAYCKAHYATKEAQP